jgi:pyruvate dehydrogenase E2 component (dihydrolipoamide acetyltransferase)
MSERIHAITVPKWGMAMDAGTVTGWHVAEGQPIAVGQDVLDVESTKIANAIEAKAAGTLRRIVGQVGDTLPVGGLLGVVAAPDVPDAEIDAFVAGFVVASDDGEDEGGPRTRMVMADGRAIRVQETGAGDGTIVLVHGFGGDLNGWMFVQPALTATRRVVALDLPGHGGSTMDVGEGTVAALARVLTATLDALGIERAHLVGHSLGGAVCLAAAGRASALTLIASAGLGPVINGAYIEAFLAAERRKDMAAALGALFADPALVTRQMAEDVLKAKRIDGARAALRAIATACFPAGRQVDDLRGRLAGVRVPAQVIWGLADQVIPIAQADGLPATVAVHRLDAGHMPHMERAADVARLIAALAS